MEGTTLKCGAASLITTIKNPISVARVVMDHTSHNYIIGASAEKLARDHGLLTVEPSYFYTQKRKFQLITAKAQKAISRDHDLDKSQTGQVSIAAQKAGGGPSPVKFIVAEEEKESRLQSSDALFCSLGTNAQAVSEDGNCIMGTVGCVCSLNGRVAAATSTGGMTNKVPGRIGDSPIIGAGTYANDKTCAVSATGHGEEFMRYLAAYDVSARMEYGGKPFLDAVNETVFSRLPAETGGMIAVDANGTLAMVMNTPGMFRGSCDAAGNAKIGIWEDTMPFVVSKDTPDDDETCCIQ
jgi:L-asparaginase / beta-aspartyl-peptidase